MLISDWSSDVCSSDLLTFDHVIPRALGGRTTWENVATACAPCNLRKGGRTPAQAHMALAARPERPSSWELQENGRGFPPNFLHETWRDYLYWDTELLACSAKGSDAVATQHSRSRG